MPAKTQAPAKARRLEEIAASKKGLFALDPTLLSIEPGFNERINYGNIRQLAEDIAENGLETPLKIRKLKGSETIYIVHGHRRHRAITEILIPEGRWHMEDASIRTVDCYAEEQGTSDFDRLVGQLSSNTGLPYNLLEKAAGYKRLLEMDPSIKPADLARRFGESKQAVSDALRLSREGSAKLHKAILSGTMAASTAIAIIKQAGADHAAQDTLLASATTAANGHNITPKHIPAAEPEPPAPPHKTETPPPFIDPNPNDNDQSDSPDSSDSPDQSDSTDQSDSPDSPTFTLFVFEDAPDEPISTGSPFYHETDRLALVNPSSFGVDRLHLLFAATTFGAAYGYRINDIEVLPDVSDISLDSDPSDGFGTVLDYATRRGQLSEDLAADLRNALYDAIAAYYPERGTAKEPTILSFARASQTETPPTGSNNPGFQKTLNAPSGGGSGGGSGSTYLDPQTFKAVEKIEKVLEDLAEKDKGIPERVTTADIVLGVLRNERPASDLKNYLLGK